MAKARVHVFVNGRVQGVFFRQKTKQQAERLDVTGWVRNLPDGRVEAVFEGEEENVDKMLTWCHVGPPAARVENVTIKEEPYTGGCSDFSIKHL